MKHRLTDHIADCAECKEEGPGEERVAALEKVLFGDEPGSDADLLVRTLAAAGPLLKSRARAFYRRRVAAALGAALIPLPFVVVYANWLLGLLHSIFETLLPGTVADVLVGGYAACLVLVVSLTYAAIPILADRNSAALAEV